MSNTIVFSDKQSSSVAKNTKYSLAAVMLSPSDLDYEVNDFYFGKEII